MGKKGNWFSAIKRVFSSNPKEKLPHGSEKKSSKEKKKWGIGKLKHGESNSFIPLYREPSSIEKILGDAEREQQKKLSISIEREQKRVLSTFNIEREQERPALPMLPELQRTPPPSLDSRVVADHHKEVRYHPIPITKNHRTSAIKIQAAYRGYMARRSFRALKGLVRLQGVVRGQGVKRQTTNAMKCMQLLVKVQSQIQSRRIQMLENQVLQHQKLQKGDKEQEGSLSSLGKWTLTQPYETSHNQDEWDDSLLTKEEIEARMQRKVEAVIKRERAFAYAYSNQLWKETPKSAHAALMEIRSGGFPWWWNWLEQFPSQTKTKLVKSNATPPPKPAIPATPPQTRPQSSNFRQPKLGFDNLDSLTPKSSKSPLFMKPKHTQTPPNRGTQTNPSTPLNHVKSRTRTPGIDFSPLRDDESLTSCPPFSVPNYMVPTVSAKAKVRAQSHPKDRYSPATPNLEKKRRLSFPLSWHKGPLFSSKDSTSQRILGKHKSLQSMSNLSVDSTVSLPVGIGRKTFK